MRAVPINVVASILLASESAARERALRPVNWRQKPNISD